MNKDQWKLDQKRYIYNISMQQLVASNRYKREIEVSDILMVCDVFEICDTVYKGHEWKVSGYSVTTNYQTGKDRYTVDILMDDKIVTFDKIVNVEYKVVI